ncbi:MAG: VOC family protein [archaeon]
MGGISPLLVSRNIDETVRFYEEKLGFKTTMRFPPAGALEFANLVLGEHIVMFISRPAMLSECMKKGDKKTPKIFSKNVWGVGVNLYFTVIDVDDMYKDVKSKKTRIVYDIENKQYGTREFTISDPDGYLLTFAQTKEFPKCESCGMSMRDKKDFGGGNTDNKYCVHCTDTGGKLKNKEEIRDGMIQLAMKTMNLNLQDAVKMVDDNMRKMPAWKKG